MKKQGKALFTTSRQKESSFRTKVSKTNKHDPSIYNLRHILCRKQFSFFLSIPEKYKFSYFGHLLWHKTNTGCSFCLWFWLFVNSKNSKHRKYPGKSKQCLDIQMFNLWFWSSQTYCVFYGLRQTKYASGGLILGLSQFSHLPHNASKRELTSKAVISDSKIFAPCCLSKSLKHTVSALWPEC